MTRTQHFLLTAGGLGHMRPFSATWGSIPPVAIALIMIWAVGEANGWMLNITLILLAIAFSIVCVRFGEIAERKWMNHDPRQVVADEVAGMSLTLLFMPWRTVLDADAWLWNGAVAGIAFVMFRIIDIVKPPPAHKLQDQPGGWGIVLDDLVAGIYALIATQLLVRLVLPEAWA